MRRVGSPKLGLRHSNQKENPDAGFCVWPRYQNWKANSRIAARPQITKRRSAGPLSGAGGIARRRTPYHGPAAHIGCGASDRPTCRSRSRRSRSTVAPSSRPNSSKPVRQGDPPVRTAAQPAADQWRPRALLWIMRYEFYACYELPRSVEALIQYSKSLQHLYNQYRPHGALAGQTPASYLKER